MVTYWPVCSRAHLTAFFQVEENHFDENARSFARRRHEHLATHGTTRSCRSLGDSLEKKLGAEVRAITLEECARELMRDLDVS